SSLATSAVHAQGGVIHGRDSNRMRYMDLHGQKLVNGQRDVEVFVRLDEPAVSELNLQSVETTGAFATPEAQRAQAARVTAQQASIRGALASRGATILSAHRVGANGLRIRVKASEVEGISVLPGVRSVGRVEIHTLDNIDSVPWIGAPAVWSSVGKGEGVRIGIIDSGIDYTHADFGGSGIVADHDNNNPNVIEPGTFPTAKVKGGYDFAGSQYDASDPALSTPQPDPDPIDYGPGGGHGSHVAGTAAGIGVQGSVGPGVAPGASLYAIKVFGDSGGSTDLTSLGIEWAMDPNGDGDMSDHLDVINMSLGAPFGNPDDPSAISSQNAAALGIVVVASAGNEGTTPYVTGAPAVAPAAISVAASKPGGNHLYSRFSVDAPAELVGTYESEEGAGPVTLAQTGPISGALVRTAPLNACAPLTNAAAVSGKIALVTRGVCGFVVKYQQAQAAGAKAIVVFNDGADPTRINPIIMGGLDNTVTIPGLMIAYPIGAALASAVNPSATLQAAPDADAIASFSSLGPGGGGSSFKPDLSAPGQAIISAGMGTGTGSANFSGTSMAAPHVTGAAALLRQEFPKLDQSAIKAMLQNSTVDASQFGDTRLTRTGVGVIRVDRAAALTSYAAPGGVSFGRLNPVFPINREQHVKLSNLATRSRSYSVSHVANRTYPGVKVQCPSQVRVGPKGSTRFDIDLTFDPRQAWRQNVFDDALASQTEVDGWCVLKDGKDTLRVGYIAVVDAASAVLPVPGPKLRSVNLINTGPALGIAEGFTLAKLGGDAGGRRTQAAISAVGFRNANPALYFDLPVLEFGIALQKPFEHISTFEFDLLIDTNGDGVEDFILVGVDYSTFNPTADPGAFVTAQFPADPNQFGFIDWFVSTWDFNDRTLILPFTLEAGGGFLPPKFDYTLITFAGDGTQDVQQGSVDLAKEIVPDVNSIGIDPGGRVNVQLTGPTGYTLWLLQNDTVPGQTELSFTIAPRKK
ncbi:MAG TPA: S8 family serine peptidase, partial [Povalibacter sp.]|nr:S8 family serine peptidase [Povalibacter sp.]